jgi:hypothetical protein
MLVGKKIGSVNYFYSLQIFPRQSSCNNVTAEQARPRKHAGNKCLFKNIECKYTGWPTCYYLFIRLRWVCLTLTSEVFPSLNTILVWFFTSVHIFARVCCEIKGSDDAPLVRRWSVASSPGNPLSLYSASELCQHTLHQLTAIFRRAERVGFMGRTALIRLIKTYCDVYI